MEAFNNRQTSSLEQSKILLPISFGSSSLALFYLLDKRYNKRHQPRGRRPYRLLLYHIYSAAEDGGNAGTSKLQNLKRHYPDHEYLSAPLESVSFSQCQGEKSALSLENEHHGQLGHKKRFGLTDLLSSRHSECFKSGILDIARTRLILATAEANQCEYVAWSDSATKLAERTLTEVANGRGSNVPSQLGNDTIPNGLQIMYPLRDLLRKEILHFMNLAAPESITQLSTDTNEPETRKTAESTIGGLMHDYINSAEGAYPSVVANVVKTAGRLVSPPGTFDGDSCQLCAFPVSRCPRPEVGTEPSKLVELVNYEPSCPHACFNCWRRFGNFICSLAIIQEVGEFGVN